MWAIIDARAPKAAIEKLRESFEVLEFKSKGITYDEVSGHPDIFIFQDEDKLIIAPNSPKELVDFLTVQKANFIFGKKEVGVELHNSTQYNCIATKDNLFHKEGFTDEIILDNHSTKKLINLPQAYTCCSLSKLGGNKFITSDKGIYKVLKSENFSSLLVNPKSIKLPGYPYGFFGGTNGIFNNDFYLIGSFKYLAGGDEIKSFIGYNDLNVIELCDCELYDGGGVFFGDSHS